MKRIAVLFLIAICFSTTPSDAQQAPGGGQQAQRGVQAQPTTLGSALDPTPVDPSVDPNIDMFINDYRNSKPRTVYSSLVVRDILTKLDSPDRIHPTHKGAVLTNMTAVSYATLAPGASASGRVPQGDVQIFLAAGGEGKIEVNSKSYDIKDGIGFTLTPNFDFKLTSTGKVPMSFYIREQPLPNGYMAGPDLVVASHYDIDRHVGAHWVNTCGGGPDGMLYCTIPPHTMPQPHSDGNELVWIIVKGETTLSLGKNLRRMEPGSVYKVPPTGITALSNINLGDEPTVVIYMAGLGRGTGNPPPAAGAAAAGGTAVPAAPVAAAAARGQALASGAAAPGGAGGQGRGGQGRGGGGGGGGAQGGVTYAALDGGAYNPATDLDPSMFMGNWRDSFPRIIDGNLYMRDMLTAFEGSDPLHPTKKGAVLTNAVAVSYAQLEPGSSARAVEGQLKGVQQSFVVNSGTGVITSGSSTFDLSKGKAFLLTPGLDFHMTATGDHYLTFYVVTEKLPDGFIPQTTLQVVDNSAKPQVTKAWYDKERPLITKEDGLSQYDAMTQVELPPMEMSRPYSDAPGTEEIWIATDGDVEALIGKQLRNIPAGTAYRVPATGRAAHTNINTSTKTAQFLYMVAGDAPAPANR